MAARAILATIVVALATALAGPPAGADAAKRPPGAKQLRLKSFDSCAALTRYGRRFAPRGPGAGPPVPVAQDFFGPAPPRRDAGPLPVPERADGIGGPLAQDDSGTNVQEAGVDEPDIVKAADGRIYAIAGNRLHAVDASGPGLLDSLELEGRGHALLLSGRKLLVISQTSPALGRDPESDRPRIAPDRPFDDVTMLTEVDVSDPSALRVLRTERIRGVHVSSRLIGRSARVVVWSRPRAALEPALRARVRGWLPRRVLRDRASGRVRFRRAADCRRVLRPTSFSGTDTLTVLTVDLARGLPAVDSDAILSGGQIAYASRQSLYVATPRWTAEPDGAEAPPDHAGTLIHRFDISDPHSTRYRSSGRVPGYLLNQFSLSEHRGVLRVASTEEPAWWTGGTDARSESRVTALDERDGALVEIGHVGGLGKGERIYAVRFIEDAGYVVTFRQVDPLYTLDLSRPARPRVAGELEILGYSAYLHPIADDLLLGLGQDATERGATLGTQLSLFDVGDPSRPRRLHQRRLDQHSGSAAEYDHHAFLWWAPAKLAVIPLQSYLFDDAGAFTGAIGLTVDSSAGIAERGRAVHDADAERFPWPIERSFVVGGRLFTLSQIGLEVNSLPELAQQAWLAFPPP